MGRKRTPRSNVRKMHRRSECGNRWGSSSTGGERNSRGRARKQTRGKWPHLQHDVQPEDDLPEHCVALWRVVIEPILHNPRPERPERRQHAACGINSCFV